MKIHVFFFSKYSKYYETHEIILSEVYHFSIVKIRIQFTKTHYPRRVERMRPRCCIFLNYSVFLQRKQYDFISWSVYEKRNVEIFLSEY